MISVLFMLYALNEIHPMPTIFFIIAWVLYILNVIQSFLSDKKNKE